IGTGPSQPRGAMRLGFPSKGPGAEHGDGGESVLRSRRDLQRAPARRAPTPRRASGDPLPVPRARRSIALAVARPRREAGDGPPRPRPTPADGPVLRTRARPTGWATPPAGVPKPRAHRVAPRPAGAVGGGPGSPSRESDEPEPVRGGRRSPLVSSPTWSSPSTCERPPEWLMGGRSGSTVATIGG